MKVDAGYSAIYRCPATNVQLTERQVFYSAGVCPRCGNISGCTITHYRQEVGYWLRPDWWERLLGKRPVWVPKDRAQ